jgi:hypothetical protein
VFHVVQLLAQLQDQILADLKQIVLELLLIVGLALFLLLEHLQILVLLSHVSLYVIAVMILAMEIIKMAAKIIY